MRNAPKKRPVRKAEPSGNGRLDSLAFLQASLASVQANVFLADPAFTIVYANERALRTLRGLADELRRAFGVEVDDIVGGSIHRFHRDPRRVEQILRNPAALPHETEFTFGPVTLQTTINAVHGPGREVLGYVVNWEDVSAKQLVEAEYVSQVEALSKSQAVIAFQMDGTILTANDNFLRVMGYTLEEVKGRHHSLFVDPATRGSPEYKDFWARLGRGEFQAAEYKRLGKGGKEVWLQATYNPILDRKGKPFKVVKFASEITAQVKMRTNLQALLQQVTENATVLASASQELIAVSQQMAANAEQTATQANVTSAAAEQVSKNVA